MRTCPRCGEPKAVEHFRVEPGRAGGLASYCRPCESAYQKRYRALNVERLKLQRAAITPEEKRASDLWSNYRATVEQYDALLESQGGACAICGEVCPSGRRLAVDHDHACCPGPRSCGKCIRELLCSRCNPGLGYFRDNIELLRKAVAYLERHSFE